MGQRIYDTSAVHRISDAEMESQIQAPLLSVTITSAFPGFQRSMTYQNGTWSCHVLTHHFHDDRASISYSSASRGVQQNDPYNSSLLFLHRPRNQHLLKACQLLLICPIALLRSRECPHYKPWQLTLTILTSCAPWSSTGPYCALSCCHKSQYRTFLLILPAQVHLNAVVLLPAHPLLLKKGVENAVQHPESAMSAPLARTMALAPQIVRSSPSSNPPPDKKASNEKAPASKLSQMESVVSEASVLPPPPSSQLAEPNPPQKLTSRSSLSQWSTPRSQLSPVPQASSVGYQGIPDPQRTLKEIMHEYPDILLTFHQCRILKDHC